MITTLNLPDEDWNEFKGIVYSEGWTIRLTLLKLIKDFNSNHKTMRGNDE